ncbi:GAF and ANTAR domain-containing protein [Streptomyces sp. NPDC001941]|uniref:GAF and ANTAR domain-containing protein n=1 Tax=Streptomyces sp. NPDC001941 TaxID=3154659 RepID=UPI003328130C
MAAELRRLADMFVELAGGRDEEPFDVPALLSTLTGKVAELFDCQTAAVFDTGVRTGPEVAGSSPEMAQLELESYGQGEGPGRDCRLTGEALTGYLLDSPAARVRWPRFVPRALELKGDWVTALPLRGRTKVVGALVLLGQGDAGTEQRDLAQAMADVSAIALMREREVQDGRALAGQLEHALSSRVLIEQAKGVLATRGAVSMEKAFDQLRGYARAHRCRLVDVARDVVEGRGELVRPRG